MIGVIALVTAVVSSMSDALAVREVNATIRNINSKTMELVASAKCVKVDGEGSVLLYSDKCDTVSGKIVYSNKNIIVSNLKDETALDPSDVEIGKIGNNPIFTVSDNNLLKINIDIKKSNGKIYKSVQYRTSYIAGT